MKSLHDAALQMLIEVATVGHLELENLEDPEDQDVILKYREVVVVRVEKHGEPRYMLAESLTQICKQLCVEASVAFDYKKSLIMEASSHNRIALIEAATEELAKPFDKKRPRNGSYNYQINTAKEALQRIGQYTCAPIGQLNETQSYWVLITLIEKLEAWVAWKVLHHRKLPNDQSVEETIEHLEAVMQDPCGYEIPEEDYPMYCANCAIIELLTESGESSFQNFYEDLDFHAYSWLLTTKLPT